MLDAVTVSPTVAASTCQIDRDKSSAARSLLPDKIR